LTTGAAATERGTNVDHGSPSDVKAGSAPGAVSIKFDPLERFEGVTFFKVVVTLSSATCE
jgi:hypothetical protein